MKSEIFKFMHLSIKTYLKSVIGILCVMILLVCTAFIAELYLPSRTAKIIEDDIKVIVENEAESLAHLPAGSLKDEVAAVFPDNS